MKLYQFNAIMVMLHYIAWRLSPDGIASAFMVMALVFFVLVLITGIAELHSCWGTAPSKSARKVDQVSE